MKTLLSLSVLLIIAGFLHGCTENQLQKTKDFAPEVLNYEFYIEGEIGGKLLRYRQINYDWTNVSNKYFIDHQETWLQAYVDSLGEIDGSWTIRIHDIDIRSIELPYTLKESEGNIGWYDERIDDIIENNANCQGIDAGCSFFLESGESDITLISNENNILEGEFSGKAYIYGTGFTPYHDESIFHDIVKGKFRIKYRTE
ncbi:MAG: hypothetical protein IPN60_07975 [Saprospiraceae bacterium]|nr:hypothetical protein [Candidatus Opimibacter skivensis]